MNRIAVAKELVKLAREIVAQNMIPIQKVLELIRIFLPDLRKMSGSWKNPVKNRMLENEIRELESLLDGSWKHKDKLVAFHLSTAKETLDWSKLPNKEHLLESLKEVFDAIGKKPIFLTIPPSEFEYPFYKKQWEDYGEAAGIKPRFNERTKTSETPKSMDELRKTLPGKVLDYLDKQECPYHHKVGHASCIMEDAFDGHGDSVLLQVMRNHRKEFFKEEKEVTHSVTNVSQFPEQVLVGFGTEKPRVDTGEGYYPEDEGEHFGW